MTKSSLNIEPFFIGVFSFITSISFPILPRQREQGVNPSQCSASPDGRRLPLVSSHLALASHSAHPPHTVVICRALVRICVDYQLQRTACGAGQSRQVCLVVFSYMYLVAACRIPTGYHSRSLRLRTFFTGQSHRPGA